MGNYISIYYRKCQKDQVNVQHVTDIDEADSAVHHHMKQTFYTLVAAAGDNGVTRKFIQKGDTLTGNRVTDAMERMGADGLPLYPFSLTIYREYRKAPYDKGTYTAAYYNAKPCLKVKSRARGPTNRTSIYGIETSVEWNWFLDDEYKFVSTEGIYI